jgi:hypothetical protein
VHRPFFVNQDVQCKCHLATAPILTARPFAHVSVKSPTDLDRLNPEDIQDPEQRDQALRWLFDLQDDFSRLMDHDAVLPYLVEFVDEKLRLDGAYALVKVPGEGVPLHARARSPRERTGWYHVHHGQITSGLTEVEWALADMPPGTRGFRCVPGSHNASFDLPFAEMESFAKDVSVGAGDVIIFAEALTHGSRWHRAAPTQQCPERWWVNFAFE